MSDQQIGALLYALSWVALVVLVTAVIVALN